MNPSTYQSLSERDKLFAKLLERIAMGVERLCRDITNLERTTK